MLCVEYVATSPALSVTLIKRASTATPDAAGGGIPGDSPQPGHKHARSHGGGVMPRGSISPGGVRPGARVPWTKLALGERRLVGRLVNAILGWIWGRVSSASRSAGPSSRLGGSPSLARGMGPIGLQPGFDEHPVTPHRTFESPAMRGAASGPRATPVQRTLGVRSRLNLRGSLTPSTSRSRHAHGNNS